MARLPQPGSDNGTWGAILNDYLAQALKPDGTIKDNAITANNIAPNSITNAAIASDAVNAASIADGTITNVLLADATIQETKLSSAVQAKLNANGGTPDWSTITNKPTVIAAGADQAAARTAIGAGTSNLVIGTSSTTAKAGDYQPSAANISDSTVIGRSLITATNAAAAKTTLSLAKSDIGLGNVDDTSDADKPISNATQTALEAKLDENAIITGATKTKITYDAKGLVTAGADATTADIADSTDKRYVTDVQLTLLGATSGTNTGDQDLSGYVQTSRTVNGHALTSNVTITADDVLPIQTGNSGMYLTTNGSTAAWSVIATGGDASTNTTSSVDNEVALFSGTGGKTLKRATGSGLAMLSSGVLGTVSAPSGGVVGTTDLQILTNKTIDGPSNTITNIANSSLANSTITIAGTSTALGGLITQDTITGLSSTGLVKRTAANTLAIASSGTDYAPATSGSAVLKGNGSGGFSSAVAGTDYLAPAAIGSTVQAYDTNLTSWASKTAPSGTIIGDTDTQTLTNKTIVLPGVSSPAYGQGKLVYDTDNESLTFFNNSSNVSLQVGQEEWIRVLNNSGTTIGNGVPVYLSGASGGYPTIAPAKADAAATTIGVGLTTESIANGVVGIVTTIGIVRGVDTSAFTAGQTVYVSAATAGVLTATAPVAPNYRYRVGIVGVSSASVGTIHVTPSTAALGNGSANQLFGINNAGTAQEVKSIVGTTNNISVAHSANTITLDIGSNVPSLTAAQTFTNKRITPRVVTVTAGATPAINTDNGDVFIITGLAVAITSMTTNLTGTPTDGQRIRISITGTAARAITWGASFEASTAALPTTTVTTNRLDVDFIWNATTSKWRMANEVPSTVYISGGTDVTVADGGTGRSTSTTAYGIIAAGTTATGAQQTIAPGTSGQFLKSAGTAALGSFANITGADVTALPYDVSFMHTVGTRAVGYGTNTMGTRLPRNCTFTSVTFRCGTADASGNLVVELRKNGVTVSGTSTTVAAASQVSGGTSTGSWSFSAGDILTIYISGIGTTPGNGLIADITGVTA